MVFKGVPGFDCSLLIYLFKIPSWHKSGIIVSYSDLLDFANVHYLQYKIVDSVKGNHDRVTKNGKNTPINQIKLNISICIINRHNRVCQSSCIGLKLLRGKGESEEAVRRGPRYKPSSLSLAGFVFGGTELNSTTLCKEPTGLPPASGDSYDDFI